MKAIIIVLIVLCWLPMIAMGQIDPFGDIQDSLTPAAKATKYELEIPKETNSEKPIENGVYLGLEAGISGTNLYHKIPFDTATRLFGSDNYKRYTSINTTNSFIGLNLKLIICKWLTIDFSNSIMGVNRTITFYDQQSSYGLWVSRWYEPKAYYSLNLITNNFTINPSLTFGNKTVKRFIGFGYGRSTILSRTGSFDRKYSLKKTSEFYQINFGVSSKLGKGIITGAIIYSWSSKLAETDWNAFQRVSSVSVSYVLPLFTFKNKPKTATDPNS